MADEHSTTNSQAEIRELYGQARGLYETARKNVETFTKLGKLNPEASEARESGWRELLPQILYMTSPNPSNGPLEDNFGGFPLLTQDVKKALGELPEPTAIVPDSAELIAKPGEGATLNVEQINRAVGQIRTQIQQYKETEQKINAAIVEGHIDQIESAVHHVANQIHAYKDTEKKMRDQIQKGSGMWMNVQVPDFLRPLVGGNEKAELAYGLVRDFRENDLLYGRVTANLDLLERVASDRKVKPNVGDQLKALRTQFDQIDLPELRYTVSDFLESKYGYGYPQGHLALPDHDKFVAPDLPKYVQSFERHSEGTNPNPVAARIGQLHAGVREAVRLS